MATLSESLISDHDLRKQSIDSKRDRTQRARWAYGKRVQSLHALPEYDGDKRKPIKAREITVPRRHRNIHFHPTSPVIHRAQRRDILDEVEYENASGHDDLTGRPRPTSLSPVKTIDSDVAYSYDASRTPSQGSQILGMALARAVEKFETRETERLVKEEYEVLDEEGEAMAISGKPSKAKGTNPVDDLDDDFELV